MKPIVSVCIPTYNGAKYLAACLESILAQTFSDLEIIIVDDCSSDDTVRVANTFARRDRRIRIVVNDINRGLVGNWNYAAELARGTWIKFVFQDDLILPDCVARMHAVAMDTAIPIISCARDFTFEDGTPDGLRTDYLDHRARIQAVFRDSAQWSARDFCEAALQSLVIWNILGEPTAVLLHRDVFRRFGWFNPHLRMLCDFEFWARVASNTGTVHIPQSLAIFRVHETSTSGFFRASEARRYRFNMVDPLLILHEYAFHPLFANLRAVAAHRHSRVDLESEFWRRALLVHWFARHAARDSVPRDVSLLDEWQVAARDCPRLASIPLKIKFLAKLRALEKTVTSWVKGWARP